MHGYLRDSATVLWVRELYYLDVLGKDRRLDEIGKALLGHDHCVNNGGAAGWVARLRDRPSQAWGRPAGRA